MSNTNGIEEMPMMDKPDVVGESPQVSEMGFGLNTQTGAIIEDRQVEPMPVVKQLRYKAQALGYLETLDPSA